jgi:hypothetical protein
VNSEVPGGSETPRICPPAASQLRAWLRSRVASREREGRPSEISRTQCGGDSGSLRSLFPLTRRRDRARNMLARPAAGETRAGAGAERTDGRCLAAGGDAGLPLSPPPHSAAAPSAPGTTHAENARARGSPAAWLRCGSPALATRRSRPHGSPGCGGLRTACALAATPRGERSSALPLPAPGSGLRLPAPRPHPPGSGPRGRRTAPAEGAAPPRRARSVCFPCPTDVSQNIGHMFSSNKLGMSANTLGLRWLFQLPHGRLGREGGLPPSLGPCPPKCTG